MVKTQADIIVYYFINLEQVFFINRVEFQNWFKEHEYDKRIAEYGLGDFIMKCKKIKNYDKTGLDFYYSKGKVFPITFFEKTFKGCYRKYLLEGMSLPYEYLILQALTKA